MDKPFAVVKFPQEDDSLAVVPLTWLSEQRDMCAWRAHIKGSKVSGMVERQVPPGTVGSGWGLFPVIVMSLSRTYQKALKKAKRLECSSTVETSEVSAHEVLPEEEEPYLGVPSPRKQLSNNYYSKQHLAPSRSARDARARPFHYFVRRRTPSAVSCSEESNANTSIKPPDRLTYIRATKWPRLLKVLASFSAAVLRILRLLLEVRIQNRDTHQQLLQLRQDFQQLGNRMAQLEAPAAEAAEPPPVIAPSPSLPRLPAMTVAELESADDAIRVECVATALKKRLMKIGGEKKTEVVANMMTSIMAHQVQAQYSLYGKKGKRPFVTMGLCTLALDAISEKLDIEQTQAKKMMVRWLPGSVDRGGGRKRRFEAAMAPPPQDPPQDLLQEPPQDHTGPH
ncbi:unnamed protein product [Ixodes hexagonus]